MLSHLCHMFASKPFRFGARLPVVRSLSQETVTNQQRDLVSKMPNQKELLHSSQVDVDGALRL